MKLLGETNSVVCMKNLKINMVPKWVFLLKLDLPIKHFRQIVCHELSFQVISDHYIKCLFDPTRTYSSRILESHEQIILTS